MSGSADVVALPRPGTVILDARGGPRALRASWHAEQGLVVLSLWRYDRCVGTFRVAAADVPVLVDTLVRGLADAAGTGSVGPGAGAEPGPAGERPAS